MTEYSKEAKELASDLALKVLLRYPKLLKEQDTHLLSHYNNRLNALLNIPRRDRVNRMFQYTDKQLLKLQAEVKAEYDRRMGPEFD